MTTEVRLSDENRRIIEVDDKSERIRKKRCCRDTRMTMIRPPTVTFPLQRLYMCCLDAFKGVDTVPSPSDDQKLRHILDGMIPEDFGLPRNLQFLDLDSSVVIYTTIYQCQNFSLYVFFLPENAVIPLHNHPGMTVFSKLLLGKVHIKAYDLVNPNIAANNPSPSQPKLACLKADTIFTAPCDTCALYPTSGGNIHAFTAITPCAILDVVGPSYSEKDGRDCSYYKDIPYAVSPCELMTVPEEDGKCYRWLEEIEMPKESEMDRIEYLGPRIIEEQYVMPYTLSSGHHAFIKCKTQKQKSIKKQSSEIDQSSEFTFFTTSPSSRLHDKKSIKKSISSDESETLLLQFLMIN